MRAHVRHGAAPPGTGGPRDDYGTETRRALDEGAAPSASSYFKQLYDCASSILRMRPIVVFAVTAGGVFSM